MAHYYYCWLTLTWMLSVWGKPCEVLDRNELILSLNLSGRQCCAGKPALRNGEGTLIYRAHQFLGYKYSRHGWLLAANGLNTGWKNSCIFNNQPSGASLMDSSASLEEPESWRDNAAYSDPAVCKPRFVLLQSSHAQFLYSFWTTEQVFTIYLRKAYGNAKDIWNTLKYTSKGISNSFCIQIH